MALPAHTAVTLPSTRWFLYLCEDTKSSARTTRKGENDSSTNVPRPASARPHERLHYLVTIRIELVHSLLLRINPSIMRQASALCTTQRCLVHHLWYFLPALRRSVILSPPQSSYRSKAKTICIIGEEASEPDSEQKARTHLISSSAIFLIHWHIHSALHCN